MKNDYIKYGLIIGGGGLAAWGLTKLANFKDTANKLTFNITRLNVGNKGIQYITLILDLEFVNPSNQTISLSLPSIKPYYGENELGFSVPMANAKVIAPNSISKISNVEIRIPTQNLLTSGLLTDVFSINLTQLTETLKQKILFRIFAVVNGLEVSIEQRFGEEAKELGYIDEVSGVFEGLGLVAAGKRKIKDGSEYNYLFPIPKGTNERVQNDGDVNDTVLWCGYVVKTYHGDTTKLAEYLQQKSKDRKDLFRNIFDFCYNHIQYHLDRKGVEELRRPAVTWHDRKYGVDCDDFTMFIASILYNLDIPFEFRITKYNRPNYQHIYLIVPVEKGTHITIDPVLDTFNYEKPYSHKKDYDMKALNLAGTGSNIGIPIEILAGNAVDNDLLKVVFGEDLQGVINGLGSTEDDEAALLRHLKRLRNTYVKHPDFIADFQDPKQAVEMLDYAIKYWNTPKRQEAIDRLTLIEDDLISKGEIKLAGLEDDDEDWEEDSEFSGVEPELAGYEYRYFGDTEDDWEDDIEFTGTEPEIAGFEYRYEEPEWEEDFGFTGDEQEDPDYEYDYSVDGLGASRRRKRKAKRAARRSKRKAKKTARRAKRKAKGGIFKRIGTGLKKGIKKVARGVMKVSAAPMRIAFLAALRTNVGKVSDKLKYAYLTEQQAIAKGIDRNEYRKLKKAHAKVENMFFKMGGNKSALKKAILSCKRKNLRGFEELNGNISGIDELDGFEHDLGFTGTEQENPEYEYRYDNQVWEVDEDFSGIEPEYSVYNYDYSFDGLNGRRLRFRKRKKPKARYRRKKGTPKKVARNPKLQDPIKKVVAWLKNVNVSSLNKKKRKQEFLNALAKNQNNVSYILSIGYKSQRQAQNEGIDGNEWKKIKDSLDKTRNLFKKEFSGSEAELKKAILLGEKKPFVNGLGAAVAAASAAAGLISKIVGWVKDIRLKKKAKKEAKSTFKETGGSSKDWRQSGKKEFNSQWDSQVQEQQQASQSQPNTDFSSLISNQLKSGTSSNYALPGTSAQNMVPGNSFNSGAGNSVITPVNYTASGNNVKESALKAFLSKHKKKLLIGGGILGAGALAYVLLKPKDKPEPKKLAAPKISGVGRTQNRKKKPSKANTNAKKIIEVKLN